MEARIEKLEEFADEVRKELRSIDVRLTKIEVLLPTLATKSDLESLRFETRTDIESLRQSTNAEIASLRVLIHQTTITMQKWMIATIIGMFLGFGSIVVSISTTFKPVVQVLPSPPAPMMLAPMTPVLPAPPAR